MSFATKTFEGFSIGDAETFSKTITEADILLFAGVSGDMYPLHLDAEYAKKTRFGARIAHGLLSASLLSTANAGLLGVPGGIYIEQDLQFVSKNPVYVGDTRDGHAYRSDQVITDRRRLSARIRPSSIKRATFVIDGEAVDAEGQDRLIRALFAGLAILLSTTATVLADDAASPAPRATPRASRCGLDPHDARRAPHLRLWERGGTRAATAGGSGFCRGCAARAAHAVRYVLERTDGPGQCRRVGHSMLTPTYYGRGFDASVTFGAQFVAGSVTNASYWGESLLPPLNPLPRGPTAPVRGAIPDACGCG